MPPAPARRRRRAAAAVASAARRVAAAGVVRGARRRPAGRRRGRGSCSAASSSAWSSWSSSSPGASNGLRRRRCGRASRAPARTSSALTSSRPDQAAWASAVRAMTRSARMPSTSNRAQIVATCRSAASGSATDGSRSPGRDDAFGQRCLGVAPPRGEGVRVGVEREPPAHHLGAQGRVARRRRVDREPEPVEQLRTQLALLRVHRADQQETRRVPHRHALPLDVGHAQRGGVEQQVDEVVVQQVHLVDVQDARGARPPAAPARRP